MKSLYESILGNNGAGWVAVDRKYIHDFFVDAPMPYEEMVREMRLLGWYPDDKTLDKLGRHVTDEEIKHCRMNITKSEVNIGYDTYFCAPCILYKLYYKDLSGDMCLWMDGAMPILYFKNTEVIVFKDRWHIMDKSIKTLEEYFGKPTKTEKFVDGRAVLGEKLTFSYGNLRKSLEKIETVYL